VLLEVESPVVNPAAYVHKVDIATKTCTGGPKICGSSPYILLHVALLAPIILRWLSIFGKLMQTLLCTIFNSVVIINVFYT